MEINAHEKSAQAESVPKVKCWQLPTNKTPRGMHLEVCGNSLYKFESSQDDHNSRKNISQILYISILRKCYHNLSEPFRQIIRFEISITLLLLQFCLNLGEHFQPSHFFSWTSIFIDRKSTSEILFIVNFAKFWRDAFRETFGIQTSSCAILIRRHPQRPLKHTTMHDARLTTILARHLGSLRYFKTNFVVFNSRTLLPLSHNSMLKFSKFLLTCF